MTSLDIQEDLKDELKEQHDGVFGVAYANAKHEMSIIAEQLNLQSGVGFSSREECAEWAEEHLLTMVAFSSSGKTFYNVSHKGELLKQQAYNAYYESILFYWELAGKTKKRVIWTPNGFEFFDKAKIAGEISDGTHNPLFYRDYTRPTGYFNKAKSCFNIAKPFPCFARETGRDTSHIYTLIEHIAGECSMHLLAWLRTKMINPCSKTQVIPIIVSRAQGSGKSSFAEVICKGLFGKDNVIVSDQYDSSARFNSDYADALIVCQEEKELEDKRNPASALKSRATATTIRKELKGVDPIYQESYTDFVMTTNKDVPIKFDGREDQRRFMIMQADENFTRKTSELADEVFSKLYGYDANGNKVGTPFLEDKELIEQFKYELYTREDIKNVELRNFPKTAAYKRCFTLPRTNEGTEIESILRALCPFIVASLKEKRSVRNLGDIGPISTIIQYEGALEYIPETNTEPAMVALCRPLVFYETLTQKPYAHATVERCLIDCTSWLMTDFGIKIIPESDSLKQGFKDIPGRYKVAPAARFVLLDAETFDPSSCREKKEPKIAPLPSEAPVPTERIGQRMRINDSWHLDPSGCFETVNEMKEGVTSLKDKSNNVQYMDTFVFESDDCSSIQAKIEKDRAEEWKAANPDEPISSMALYAERLEVQKAEAKRLYKEGIACRVVYSGAKSYHILVRVADAPKTLEEYQWLHGYLCTVLSDKLDFDPSTCDPARLTRSPVTHTRSTYNVKYGIEVVGNQHLVYENFNNVYRIEWRDIYQLWKDRPLKPYERNGKKMLPTKQEYKDAVEAILEGTFWTDNKWDGNRQKAFFPAYRLLRSLGYSHLELWTDEIIYKNLTSYKKQNEISYWKTRAYSDIIRQIDEDFDNDDEEQ